MPANIYLTKQQVAQIAELDEDVHLLEQTGANEGLLEVWVVDDPHRITIEGAHRSIILDSDGNILGDEHVDN